MFVRVNGKEVFSGDDVNVVIAQRVQILVTVFEEAQTFGRV